MKKEYATPVVEKITFDYRIQTLGSTSCYGSVINVSHGVTECDEGTPSYIGWNSKNPGDL